MAAMVVVQEDSEMKQESEDEEFEDCVEAQSASFFDAQSEAASVSQV